jgi:hypothetical protein
MISFVTPSPWSCRQCDEVCPINRLEKPCPQPNQYGVCTDTGFITSQTATPIRNTFWTRDVSVQLDTNFVQGLFVIIIVWRDTLEIAKEMHVILAQFWGRISIFWINATTTIQYKFSWISFRRLTSCHVQRDSHCEDTRHILETVFCTRDCGYWLRYLSATDWFTNHKLSSIQFLLLSVELNGSLQDNWMSTQCADSWPAERIKEWMNEWMAKCMCVWMNELINDGVNDWMPQWVNEWMTGYVNL